MAGSIGKASTTGPARRASLGLVALLLAGCVARGWDAVEAAEESLQVRPMELSERYRTGDTFMGIRLRGTLELSSGRIDGLDVAELSGLAWDQDEGLLYALSDKGRLFHLRPVVQGEMLVDVKLVAGYLLRDARGRPLRGALADSEGLAVDQGRNGRHGDSRLLVSFEGKPRIGVFRPDGTALGSVPIARELRDASRYVSRNKALEAVARDAHWGVVTAPEWPLRSTDARFIPIFDEKGHHWEYPRASAPKSALVDMAATPEGSLLTLERSFVSYFSPVVISLRRTRLTAPGNGERLSVEDVAVFDSTRGWLLDNFEGLTWYRDNRFFMVSDDNRFALQRTLLMFFELTDRRAATP